MVCSWTNLEKYVGDIGNILAIYTKNMTSACVWPAIETNLYARNNDDQPLDFGRPKFRQTQIGPQECVIQRKIEHDCTYSLPVGWRACFLVHTTVMAYGSKQLRSSLVRQSVVDTPPILDTLQKKIFASWWT